MSEDRKEAESSTLVEKAASALSMAAIQQAAKEKYDVSLNYVRDFWNKPRGSLDKQGEKASTPVSTGEQRNYNKIYEKYLMPTEASQSELPVEKKPTATKSNRSGYLIQKPWELC